MENLGHRLVRHGVTYGNPGLELVRDRADRVHAEIYYLSLYIDGEILNLSLYLLSNGRTMSNRKGIEM